MPSTSLERKLLLEFETVKLKSNPPVSGDIKAVVIISGESRDPAVKTEIHDTEERLAEGIRIYKKIEKLGGSPTLVLNGTDHQNIFMIREARKKGIGKIIVVKNPPYPIASTKTQILGIVGLNFKKMALVTHAYHGPRTFRHAKKMLPNSCEFKLFLIARDKINQGQIQEEIEKITEYASKGDIDL